MNQEECKLRLEDPLLDLRLLGPFRARVNGMHLPRTRSRKTQWLLALLALRAGSEVEREWLAESLWPDRSTREALVLMRRELTDLRRVMGPAAALLSAPTPRTLSLDPARAFVDVIAFDQALDRGDTASLEEAVSLYRGSLLQGWHEEWLFDERIRREQTYLEVLEALVSYTQAVGDRPAAQRYLRLLIGVEPLRESAHRKLMQLLAAGGNYAAAFQTYRDLRLLLHRELNVAPDPETTALFQQIRKDTRNRMRSAPDAHAHRLPPHGFLRSPAAATSGTAVTHPPNQPAAQSPRGQLRSNLPLQLTRFIGREKEAAAVIRLLDARRLVTLTGAGGCGKTRLALHTARGMIEEFGDGVWLIELAALTDPALVPRTVAAALGLREEPRRPVIESLVDFLQAKQLLLVLDNCEHLRATSAQLAEALLKACAGLSILVTSREKLGVAGEQAYPVPPLSVPDANHPLVLDRLHKSEAMQLFSDRAALSQPDFTLTEANAAAVARVCQRLDGIPLAIELAAVRMIALPVEQIAAGLDDALRLLTGGSQTALPRQQTVRASIDWSHALLTGPEQVLLRRLSVFAGGWTLEAAEAVISRQWSVISGGKGQPRLQSGDPHAEPRADHCSLTGDVLDLLTRLVEKSLVLFEQREGSNGAGGTSTHELGSRRPHPGRYRLLETVRQYAWDRLVEAGEVEAVRRRHLAYFLTLAEEAEPLLWSEADWLERLEGEHDNLRAALDWCEKAVADGQWRVGSPAKSEPEENSAVLSRSTDPELGLRLAGALWWFWSIRGYWAEARRRLQTILTGNRALRGPESGGTEVPWKALCAAGQIAANRGEIEQAITLGKESLRLCRQAGDRRGQAWSLQVLVEAAYGQGDFARMAVLEREGLDLFREVADRRGTALGLHMLALALYGQDCFERAAALEEQCLAACRQEGYGWLKGLALNHLGFLARRLGQTEQAGSLFEESLSIHRATGNRAAMAHALHGLARVAWDTGDEARELALLEQSLAACREIADKLLATWNLWALGQYALARRQHARATACFEECLAVSRELGPKGNACRALVGLAAVAHAQANDRLARKLLEEAHRLGQGADVLLEQGHLLLEMDDYAAARSRFEEGLALHRAGSATGSIPWSLLNIAHAAWLQGESAVTHLHAREALGLFQQRDDKQGILGALESLGAAAWAQGHNQRAARLLAAVEALGETGGLTGARPWSRPSERIREAVNAAPLKQQFAAAWAEGSGMSLQQAIADALGNDPRARPAP